MEYTFNLVCKQFASKILLKEQEGLHVFKIIQHNDKNCEYYFFAKGTDSWTILTKGLSELSTENHTLVAVLTPKVEKVEKLHRDFDKYISLISNDKLLEYTFII